MGRSGVVFSSYRGQRRQCGESEWVRRNRRAAPVVLSRPGELLGISCGRCSRWPVELTMSWERGGSRSGGRASDAAARTGTAQSRVESREHSAARAGCAHAG